MTLYLYTWRNKSQLPFGFPVIPDAMGGHFAMVTPATKSQLPFGFQVIPDDLAFTQGSRPSVLSQLPFGIVLTSDEIIERLNGRAG